MFYNIMYLDKNEFSFLTFDIKVAEKLGLTCGVAYFRLKENTEDGKLKDNTLKQLHMYFGFMTERQVRGVIYKLIKNNLIQEINISSLNSLDRTKFYKTI